MTSARKKNAAEHAAQRMHQLQGFQPLLRALKKTSRRKKKRRSTCNPDNAVAASLPGPPAIPIATSCPDTTVATLCGPQVPAVTPLCVKCKLPFSVAKSAIRNGKSIGTFKCGTCHTRVVQISRDGMYAEFMQGFKGANKETITEFWRSLGSTKTAGERLEVMNQTLVLTRRNTRQASDLGKYMPLTWYVAQGLDAALIEAECTDTMVRPMLGLCYRVPFLETGEINSDSKTRQQIVDFLDAPPRRICGPPATPVPRTVKPKAIAMPEEGAADKKAREKKESDDRRKMMSEASRIQLKVSTIVIELGALLLSTATKKSTPAWAFTAASDQLKQLKAIDANTQSVIGGSGDLKYTLADAVSVVKDAMSQKTLVISMMQRAPLLSTRSMA